MFEKVKSRIQQLTPTIKRAQPSRNQKLSDLRKASDLNDFIEKALTVPAGHIDKKLQKIASDHPDSTVADLEKLLTKQYLRRCAWASGGIGASAAVPAAGTGVAVGLSVAELFAYFSQTVEYILAISRLHGIDIDDLETRRVLTMTALLGEKDAQKLVTQLGLRSLLHTKQTLKNFSSPTLRRVNRSIAKYTAKKAAKTTSRKVFGRLFPLGIGAVVGYISGRQSAKDTVAGLATLLGPIRDLSVADFLVELQPIIVIETGANQQ